MTLFQPHGVRPAEGQVEDHVLVVVEDPLAASGLELLAGGRLDDPVVDGERHAFGRPLDAVGVPRVGAAAVRVGLLLADVAVGRVAGAVQGGAGPVAVADVLHDVRLARAGPRDRRVVDVAAEHPEGGPEAVTDRQLHAGADLAVGEVELGVGVDAAGGEVEGAVRRGGARLAVLRLQDEGAVLGADVVRRVDVGLRLPVDGAHLRAGAHHPPLGAVQARGGEVVEERGAVRAARVLGQGRVGGVRAASGAPDLQLVERVAELGGGRCGVVEGAALHAEHPDVAAGRRGGQGDGVMASGGLPRRLHVGAAGGDVGG